MASGVYFVRSCPICGRKLEIRVELLGREVECVHCGGDFVANESVDDGVSEQHIEQLLDRAREYIESVQPTNPGLAE